jgi:hypothetical protein
MTQRHSSVYATFLKIHASINGCLGCFYLLATVHNCYSEPGYLSISSRPCFHLFGI